jgi:hypothetical protein
MVEDFGNVWSYLPIAHARVITTNGSLKRNGEAVMGKGIALEAAMRFPALPEKLGKRIFEKGNKVHVFRKGSLKDLDYDLIAFPTKNEWHENADPFLIVQSAHRLADIADANDYAKIVMPRPGVGAGNLRWDDVRHSIYKILDDRFFVITFPE